MSKQAVQSHTPAGVRPFLAAGALTLLLWGLGALDPLERPLYDLRVAARFLVGSPSEVAPQVAVVAVDETSLTALGPWPWPWEFHARLVEALADAGAAAVGLDLILAEGRPGPEGEEAAARLRAALARAGPSTPVFVPAGSEAPPPTIAGAASGMGSIRLPVEPDGVVRRLPLEAGDAAPLVALLAQAVRPGVSSESSTLWLDYRRPPLLRSPLRPEDLFPTFSYASVLDGSVPREALQGRLILVGATAPGLGDRHLTALRRLGPVPGVIVHANSLRALLDPGPVRPAPIASLGLLLALLGAGWFVLARRSSAGFFFPLGALLLYGIAAFVLFMSPGFSLYLAPAVVALGGGQLLVGLDGYLRERRRRARVEETFGRYVSPAVLRELLRPDAPLEPTGRRLVVTVLVADLCDFTSFAESRPPEEAVEALNAYLEALVRPVLEAGGMVDKYLGDGFLGLFGAPLPSPDHARRALAAAEAIRGTLARVNRRRAQAGQPVLQARLALHSGEVVAGSAGIPDRLEYTSIGDTVNLVFRLEKQAAPGELVVTEAVFREAGFAPASPWQGPDHVAVPGRDATAQVYRLAPQGRSTTLV